jgi:hypothetical protein
MRGLGRDEIGTEEGNRVFVGEVELLVSMLV